jgi:hypothetical protein
MIVIYRIAPSLPVKSPISKDDKLAFFKTCLKSFVRGFQDIKPEVVFILDSCPKSYEKVLSHVSFDKKIIKMDKAGNFGTYAKQIEIASETDDFVLLQEDDYLYLPSIGKKMLEGMKTFDFITPQDEYLYYFNEPRHIGKYEIKVVGNHHWREVNSTTLTFAAHGKTFKDTKDILLGHEIWDYEMWQEIRQDYKLWCPVPTFATHMVEGILSPCVDWSEMWLS